MNSTKIVEDQGSYRIEGAITFSTVASLYDDLVKILKTTAKQSIDLDLSAVTEIDSSAIALLVAMDQRTSLTLTNTNHNISSLIKLYGVNWLTPNNASAWVKLTDIILVQL